MADPPTILLDEAALARVVARVGAEISARYDDGVVLAAVLRGSLPFLADLARSLTVHPLVDFLAITAYSPGTGRVRLLKDLDIDVGGRDVVIVEDIVDTGLTTAFLTAELERRRPRSVAVATLLDRTPRRLVPVEPAFVGRRIDDDYVVGFGLDHEGRYRNLPVVAVADRDVLAADPDAYVEALYGPAATGS